MTRTRQAVLSTLLGAALAGGPARAQVPTDPNPVDVKTELEDLKKRVGELKLAQRQMSDVILGRNEGRFPDDAGLQKRLDALADSIKRLDDKVTKLGDQVAATQRTSGFSPIAATPVAPHGTVRLVNEYPVDVSIVLNGVVHLLAPAQRKDVAVAPGEFAHALPQSGGIETRTRIRDGETVTLRIR